MTTMSPDRTALRSLNAVAGARQTARAFLEALWHPAIAPECADSVVLVVSELMNNALRHGGGTYTLRLTAHPGSIEVAVDDPSAEPPRMRVPDLRDGTGGFGWHMVNDLALATVITPRAEGGKTVRALLPR
ncbi:MULTISPECIES: ATP-binding protein [unclassified Streptomyces]|uniref:ATP-binding protein n=1 Tax=unclassified Streptomyces TaxID=2593676 RepID=UPI000DC7A4FA|nr:MULTISPECIES: ATP-binding protein [unclassified Streptomyces]AWZ08451.1 ATP-binding protein [Streptomyces sp. ICC4]AWZ13876.1 ATP-binding protein [Streptomyces sp. ICC1]